MRILIAILAIALAGCQTTQKTETVVQLKEPVTVEQHHPVPSVCRSAGHPGWVLFRKPTEEGAPLDVFLADVQKAKKAHYSGLGRVQACECLVINQWGSEEDKAKAPRYCRRVTGEV